MRLLNLFMEWVDGLGCQIGGHKFLFRSTCGTMLCMKCWREYPISPELTVPSGVFSPSGRALIQRQQEELRRQQEISELERMLKTDEMAGKASLDARRQRAEIAKAREERRKKLEGK